ncbi:hypothetical protein [Flocculibacter collagenilyticus]|uniref:hypothetical protein n=1 Tax=Flocculibacter collagenilyticus TaxID=2744479 RepID=UPI0018F76B76|nr:hypothetical protein [Flocculibacter collagenilyticus]
MRFNGVFNKICIIYATGAFGGTRLLFSTLLTYYFSNENSTNIVLSDISFVLAINLFFTIGFSMVLLKDISLAPQEANEIENRYKIESLVGLLSGIFFITLAFSFDVVAHPILCIALLVSITFYQNLRHKLLALKLFRKLTVVELVIMLQICLGVTLLTYIELIEAVYLFLVFITPYLFIFFGAIMTFRLKAKMSINFSKIKESMFVGFSNGLSGALSWLIPPLILPFVATSMSYVMTATTFLLGMVMLIPRVFVNAKLPEFIKAINAPDDSSYKKIYTSLRRVMLLIYLPLLVFSNSYFMLLDMSDGINFTGSDYLLVSLIITFGYLSQFALLDTLTLNMSERSSIVLKYNFLYFFFSSSLVFTTIAILDTHQSLVVYSIYSLLIIIVLVRNFFLRRYCKLSRLNLYNTNLTNFTSGGQKV